MKRFSLNPSGLRLPTVLAAGLCGALVLAGCTSNTSTGDGNRDAGSELSIGISGDLSTLDPWNTRTITNDLNVLSQIYTPLVYRGSDMKLEPALARSWEQADDLRWVFHLRDDIKFANGKQLNAEVVAWNINKIIDPATGARSASTLATVTKAVAVDETTVEIHTGTPDASVPAHLAIVFFVEPTWREQSDAATEVMPSGPYDLENWSRQREIVLSLREDATPYAGDPQFKTVTYKVIPEQSARIASLRTGDIDLTAGFSVDQLAGLEQSPNIKAGSVASTRTAMLYADTTEKPMDDVRVRQAVNYAIDKETIVNSLLLGETKPSQGQVLTEAYLGFNKEVEPYPYDPAKAEQLLADAGYANGLDLELTYPTGSAAMIPDQIVQAIQADLAKVGINLTTSSMPNADFVAMNYKRTNLPDLGYIALALWTLDGADLLQLIGATGGAQQFWQNDKFDELIGAAMKTSGEEREKLTREAVEVMREDAGFVFLFPQPLTYAVSTDVNFEMRADEWVRAFDITPAK
jgi:peptide/nickel transport system substrate-binding protein